MSQGKWLWIAKKGQVPGLTCLSPCSRRSDKEGSALAMIRSLVSVTPFSPSFGKEGSGKKWISEQGWGRDGVVWISGEWGKLSDVLSVENKPLTLQTRYHYLEFKRTITLCKANKGEKQIHSRETHSLRTPRTSPIASSSVAEIPAFHRFRAHETSEWGTTRFLALFITIPPNLKFIMDANNNQFVNTVFKFTGALQRYSF